MPRRIPRAQLESDYLLVRRTLMQLNAYLRDVEMVFIDKNPGAAPPTRAAYMLGESVLRKTDHDTSTHRA